MKNIKGIFSHYLFAVMAAIFLVILLPIPAVLLDILISLNILFALLHLIITLSAKKPEEYLILPTAFLFLILLNLATTIAVTRVILTKGPEFDGLLVGFISSWVSSLISVFSSGETSLIIPSISVFSLLLVFFSIVNLTIAKGMTRIAEVAARFTLDGMPVKLMAIEAELETKKITEEEAAARKNAVNSESDLYGAMDGASKFLCGNVRLSIFIVIITAAAGIFIGTKFRQEDINEAFVTYVSLAIGSGFYAIIPSFILSTTTGVAVMKLLNKGTSKNF